MRNQHPVPISFGIKQNVTSEFNGNTHVWSQYTSCFFHGFSGLFLATPPGICAEVEGRSLGKVTQESTSTCLDDAWNPGLTGWFWPMLTAGGGKLETPRVDRSRGKELWWHRWDDWQWLIGSIDFYCMFLFCVVMLFVCFCFTLFRWVRFFVWLFLLLHE